jgi:hypothetical protein
MLKPFLLVALAISPLVSVAKGRYEGEVQISTGTYGEPSALIVALKCGLQKHPHRKRFNISWGMAEPHGGNGGQLIYDQERQVLWISQQSSYWTDSNEKFLFGVSENSQQWHFSRVTLNRLRLLFARYGNKKFDDGGFGDTAFEVSFFPRLTEFGARGGLVGRTSKHWKKKSATN